jgi:hypothetical protein
VGGVFRGPRPAETIAGISPTRDQPYEAVYRCTKRPLLPGVTFYEMLTGAPMTGTILFLGALSGRDDAWR